jgi:hypothetical protein
MEIKDDVFFEQVYQKLDRIERDTSDIKVTLGVQAKDIETHIKRTNLLEESLEKLRAELAPARNITTFLKTGLQIVGAISIIASAIFAVSKLF